MSESQTGPDRRSPEPLASATEELAHVRELLAAAGRGEADLEDLKGSLQGYLGAHGPALKQSAASLTEEMRQKTLAELYKWRAQLQSQLDARGGDASVAASGQQPATSADRDRDLPREDN
jgi:hypothetical protein